jgi:hypothetical protein
MKNNGYGIFIRGRRSSEVMGNFLINNTCGIFIDWSSNKIYNNNFVNNSNNAYVNGNIESIWDGDYPLGGNYWGRLSGTDFYKGPYQNETGSDGFYDTSYIANETIFDRYPLRGLFYYFNTSAGCALKIVSNSTIESCVYNQANDSIVLSISNNTSNQTAGFCRLTLNRTLITPPFNITVNNNQVQYNVIFENEKSTIIYFDYEGATAKIVIVPEFNCQILFLAFLLLLAISTFILKRYRIHVNKTYRFS